MDKYQIYDKGRKGESTLVFAKPVGTKQLASYEQWAIHLRNMLEFTFFNQSYISIHI